MSLVLTVAVVGCTPPKRVVSVPKKACAIREIKIVKPVSKVPKPRVELPYIAAASCVDGLEVSFELKNEKTSFVVGECINVVVTAVNRSETPITIEALSGEPVKVELTWNSQVGVELVKSYPRTSIVKRSKWKIQPGSSRQYTINFMVTEDYPSYSPLKVIAYLNGREDTAPALKINIAAKKALKVPSHDPTPKDLEKVLTPRSE